jgi:hypothetical protein
MGLRGRYFEDDGKNHTLGVLLFTHLFGFMSEWSKHRLDGNETIAALDRLTIDEIAKSPSYSTEHLVELWVSFNYLQQVTLSWEALLGSRSLT